MNTMAVILVFDLQCLYALCPLPPPLSYGPPTGTVYRHAFLNVNVPNGLFQNIHQARLDTRGLLWQRKFKIAPLFLWYVCVLLREAWYLAFEEVRGSVSTRPCTGDNRRTDRHPGVRRMTKAFICKCLCKQHFYVTFAKSGSSAGSVFIANWEDWQTQAIEGVIFFSISQSVGEFIQFFESLWGYY